MDTQLQNYGTDIYTAPDKIKRVLISHSDYRYAKVIKKHAIEVCRNGISQEYVNRVCNNFSNAYIYTVDGQMIGFILWKIKKNDPLEHFKPEYIPTKELYIQLICAKKTGANFGYTMLSDVESYCVKNAIPIMTLEPINAALETYYHNYGFKSDCLMRKGIILMTKPIEALLLSDKNTKHTRKAGRKIHPLEPHDRKIIQYLVDNGTELEEHINYVRVNYTSMFPDSQPNFLSKEYLQQDHLSNK